MYRFHFQIRLYLLAIAFCFNQVYSMENILSPFHYDLGVKVLPSSDPNAKIMLAFHGYGSNHNIVDLLRTYPEINDHLVGFNFPDYRIREGIYDPQTLTFGTIQELLPALYLLKQYVIDKGNDEIHLYGFSAGAGAIINVLAVLNTSRFDAELSQIGISKQDKIQILQAIEKGHIILESPLKSIEEIIAFRGSTPELEWIAKRYRESHLRPIDSLNDLSNLKLNILIYFQDPDEVLSNRDDSIFIDKLKRQNQGITSVVIGHEGGHNMYHRSLWKAYAKFK